MIYINARFLSQEMTGVQRYACEIAIALSALRTDLIFLSPHDIVCKSIAEKLNVKIIGKNTKHLWEQFDLPCYLYSIGSPLLINLCNLAPLFYLNKIITLHDITYKKFPQSYSRKFRFAYNFIIPLLIKTCKKIVTVSNFSKQELVHNFSCDSNNIIVVYNAVSKCFGIKKNTDNPEGKKYFLAVSSPLYHKNFQLLIEAFSSISDKCDIHLKIVGEANYSHFPKFYGIHNTVCDGRVEFLGRVSDEELSGLYANAVALVFPSLYEGFGIPPIEAQACGCPVISSDAAAMPEVLEDSACYFTADNRDELSRTMLSFIIDPEKRVRLVYNGMNNIKRFSWGKSAEKLSDFLDDIS